jgi:hypothetical protein
MARLGKDAFGIRCFCIVLSFRRPSIRAAHDRSLLDDCDDILMPLVT